ncbi:MAG TPA: LON peptidase substrate-binding domain-containing protein [Actinomycetota bacterium]|nr:LON peptidase substrate-binding domain-containing protein [Actinomycetota bacterium]
MPATSFPVFALHQVVFPGAPLSLRVFEPRYRRLVDDVVPDGRFVVAAIRQGREVAGPADVFRVGVTVGGAAPDVLPDGSLALDLAGHERVALIEPIGDDPYPRWRCEPYPDEGGAGTDDVDAAVDALHAYLASIGEDEARPAVPTDPVAASYALAGAVPGLPAVRQSLLELPGAGARLGRAAAVFRREAALVRATGAGIAGADLGVSPN